MAEIYGYTRCSTDESRQDTSQQKRDLLAPGVPDDDHIYWEYEYGAKRNRLELAKLMKVVAPGDTIAATEVSRLTRSAQQLCEIMDDATSRHFLPHYWRPRYRLSGGAAGSHDRGDA